jgi:hypothetical protein
LPIGLRLDRTAGSPYTESDIRPFVSAAEREYWENFNVSRNKYGTYESFVNEPVLTAPEHLKWKLLHVGGLAPNAILLGSLDSVLQLGDQAHLIMWTGAGGQSKTGSPQEKLFAIINSRRNLIRLSTSRPAALAKVFFDGGIEGVFDPNAQRIPEKTAHDIGANFPRIGELMIPFPVFMGPNSPVFNGPNAVYDWEMFFHLPFLIAHYLNSQGKFGDAKTFYEYIFDPPAPTEVGQGATTENVWRFYDGLGQKPPLGGS